MTTAANTLHDFYSLRALVPDEDKALLANVRAFMEERVAPVINRYWTRAEFPFELIEPWEQPARGGGPRAGCFRGTSR